MNHNYIDIITYKEIITNAIFQYRLDYLNLISSKDEFKVITSVNDLNNLRYKNNRNKDMLYKLTFKYIELTYEEYFNDVGYKYPDNFNKLIHSEIERQFKLISDTLNMCFMV